MDGEERAHAETVIRRACEDGGYEVLRLQVRQDRSVTLTLDLEERAINMDDCVTMNRVARRALEEAGLEADDYAVEVESPGARRPLITLRHFERFVGERIKLKLAEPLDGQTGFQGRIAEVARGRVKVELQDGRELECAPAEIRSAHLDPGQKGP